jgi:hypothetical protein
MQIVTIGPPARADSTSLPLPPTHARPASTARYSLTSDSVHTDETTAHMATIMAMVSVRVRAICVQCSQGCSIAKP